MKKIFDKINILIQLIDQINEASYLARQHRFEEAKAVMARQILV